MARFLFTYWPVPGHINPNIAIAHALRDRGHEVSFYTGSAARSTVEGEGFGYFPFEHVDEAAFQQLVLSPHGIMAQKGRPLRQKAMWREWLLDTVPSQVADLEPVLDMWKPDVIVCDASMWSPFLILQEVWEIPVAMSSGLATCILPGPDAPVLGVPLPKPHNTLTRLRKRLLSFGVSLFIGDHRRRANELRKDYGLLPLDTTVTEFSGQLPLYILPSTPEFDYQRSDLPPSVCYVGPCVWNKPADQPPPEWLSQLPDDQPLVYVSDGTVPGRDPVVLRSAVEGLAGLPIQVVVTVGAQRDPVEIGLGSVASNIRVERWVAHSDLLPRTDIVITTGGAGTVLASLNEGIPLLVIPGAWDQPENAWRVVEAGAGLHISMRHCNPKRLREAVERLLNDASYRDNARRLADSFARYGGAARAAKLLEELSAQPSLSTTLHNSQDRA